MVHYCLQFSLILCFVVITLFKHVLLNFKLYQDNQFKKRNCIGFMSKQLVATQVLLLLLIKCIEFKGTLSRTLYAYLRPHLLRPNSHETQYCDKKIKRYLFIAILCVKMYRVNEALG